jgi:tetratricopeptide (TPR) repeat protein
VKAFARGLFVFTLGVLVGATLMDRLKGRASDRTRRMFTATDVQRAKDLAARGDLAAAREAWIRANLIHPDSFEAHLGLGIFYDCAGEVESAKRQYERAIESYPGAARIDLHAPQPDALAETQARLGRAAARLGNEKQARGAFETAIALRGSIPPALGARLDTRAGWIDTLDRLDRRCPQRTLQEENQVTGK